MSNYDYENLVRSSIEERKQREAEALEAATKQRQQEQAQIDKDAKLVAESEKQYADLRKQNIIDSLFYGLSPDTKKDLERLLDLSTKLAHVDDQYDHEHKKRIAILAEMDVLRNKIQNAGRNLGDIHFVKKVYYQSVEKDYLLFPDTFGIYHLYAGNIGAFRTTIESLQVDEKGQPVKMFHQDRIQTQPEIPISDFQTIIIQEKADPKPVQKYRPHKPIFKTQNVDPKENLSNNPDKKLRSSKRNWISGR